MYVCMLSLANMQPMTSTMSKNDRWVLFPDLATEGY